MKKLLWTSAMALTAAACMTACDDSSGASNSIPEFKTEAALPDTCEMEVAKAGDTYFACFENKWIEVTDSATVEQFKEGLDEDEIKAKLEELEDLLKPATPAKPKSSSSKNTDEDVDSSDSDEPESSASEECTGRRCNTDGKSSSSKKSSGGSGSGEGGSGEGGSSPSSSTSGSSATRDEHFKLLDEFVDWKSGTKAVLKTTVDFADIEAALKTDGFADGVSVDNEETAVTMNWLLWVLAGEKIEFQKDDMVYNKTNETQEDSTALYVIFRTEASDAVVYVRALSRGVCGSSVYFKDNQVCEDGKVLTKCGTETFALDYSIPKVCDEGVVKGICGGDLYNLENEFCDSRDNHIYGYVIDGYGYGWMTENLAYKTKNAKYYNNDVANEADGYYYTYGEATTACPTGWEVPELNTWRALSDMSIHYDEISGEITFKTIGYYYKSKWYEKSDYAYYWTVTEYNDGARYIIKITSSGDSYEMDDYAFEADDMNQVRCTSTEKISK